MQVPQVRGVGHHSRFPSCQIRLLRVKGLLRSEEERQMLNNPIYNSIVAKHRRRLMHVPDTMRVIESISHEEKHNLAVLEEMREELAQHLLSR